MNCSVSVLLLLIVVAAQATATHDKGHGGEAIHRKKHFSEQPKLVVALESGDVLTRLSRGAVGDGGTTANNAGLAPSPANDNGGGSANEHGNGNNAPVGSGGGGGGGKRARNNNRKSNKHGTPENSPNSGRKHSDKKFSAANNSQTPNQQQPQQQHVHSGNGNGNGNGNGKNKGKQRQLLKSQQHQNHGKRAGGKSKGENAAKAGEGHDKPQSTCRYAKSAWSDCDVGTNMRSRTLTLKKGESNCLPTRTITKKCKKSCRYEKGSWSECTNGTMTRLDKLKTTGSNVPESSCEAVRSNTKKCNPGGSGLGKQQGGKANRERKNKDKASRRAQQQA